MLPFVVLAVALAGVSFGSIFARLAAAPALAIALWRMTLASAVALPVAAGMGQLRPAAAPRETALAVAAGGLLALHFGSWITSLQLTTVANSVLLVNTAPLFVALLSWAAGRRPGRRTWVAVALALGGAVIIASGSLADSSTLLGNLLALVGAVAMAGYLMLAREAQGRLAYLPYVATAYISAAAVLWTAVLISGTPWRGYAAETWWALAAMAAVSQLVGHGGCNWSLRHLQPAFVSIALTGEPVIAALLAWWLLGEPVTGRTALGGALVLAGVIVAVRAARRLPGPVEPRHLAGFGKP
jgi:drug/metabolite transporter (DMT)-like permease